MKITRSKLKEIIKEELAMEEFAQQSRVVLPRLERYWKRGTENGIVYLEPLAGTSVFRWLGMLVGKPADYPGGKLPSVGVQAATAKSYNILDLNGKPSETNVSSDALEDRLDKYFMESGNYSEWDQ